MFFNKISRRTTYLILLVIGCNFFMFKKCGSGGSPPPPPPGPGAPTGHNNNTPISVNPSEYNNHLTALGSVGGISCLYDASLSQSIHVEVKYFDANGVKHTFSTANLTQTSLASGGGSINLNGIDIPTDGDFWLEASITLDCSVCCDKNVILRPASRDPTLPDATGFYFNPISPPPPPNQTLGQGQPV